MQDNYTYGYNYVRTYCRTYVLSYNHCNRYSHYQVLRTYYKNDDACAHEILHRLLPCRMLLTPRRV